MISDLDPASYLALVTALAVLCQVLAWTVRIPSILVLLLVGFGLGQLVTPDEVLGREVLFGGVGLAVGIILFEGSLSLRLHDIRDLRRPILRLCSVTVALAWLLITLTGWLLGFPLEVALLVGAILVVTGPTVIAPILRQLRPTRRVSALLRWEGIVVDPIGAVLAVLVFQAVLAGAASDPFVAVLRTLATTIVVATVIAFVLGLVLEVAIKRRWVPDFLHGAVFLAAAVGALALSNLIQAESGLLTVTLLGIFLANRPNLHLEHVTEFKEHLQVLLVGMLFVILAGRVTPDQVVDIAPTAGLYVLALDRDRGVGLEPLHDGLRAYDGDGVGDERRRAADGVGRARPDKPSAADRHAAGGLGLEFEPDRRRENALGRDRAGEPAGL